MYLTYMRIKVEIKINGDPDQLSSLIRALEPDNVGLPQDIKLEMNMSKGQLNIIAEGDTSRIPTILNTLDEILSLAKSTLEAVEDKR